MTNIVLCGESYGESEDALKYPFVGPAGMELLTLLEDSGILTLTSTDRANIKQRWNASGILAAHYMREIWEAHKSEFHLTNVFNQRPPNNDLDSFCVNKTDSHPDLPALRAGKYLRHEYVPELTRLYSELKAHRPNLIIALGNTPTWALLGHAGISRVRGVVALSAKVGIKVLPTFHPAAILRQYDNRAVTVLDLEKARYESTFREIRRPERRVYIEPTLSDLNWFFDQHIRSARYIAPDIETVAKQISCIGFATAPDVAMVVPFIDNRKENGSYWATAEEEVKAWNWVRKVLSTPQPKVMQNGQFDCNFLWKGYGIPVNNFAEDDMLLHYSLQPESQKSLGFLGSCYTSEQSWKLLGRKASKTIKRED